MTSTQTDRSQRYDRPLDFGDPCRPTEVTVFNFPRNNECFCWRPPLRGTVARFFFCMRLLRWPRCALPVSANEHSVHAARPLSRCSRIREGLLIETWLTARSKRRCGYARCKPVGTFPGNIFRGRDGTVFINSKQKLLNQAVMNRSKIFRASRSVHSITASENRLVMMTAPTLVNLDKPKFDKGLITCLASTSKMGCLMSRKKSKTHVLLIPAVDSISVIHNQVTH